MNILFKTKKGYKLLVNGNSSAYDHRFKWSIGEWRSIHPRIPYRVCCTHGVFHFCKNPYILLLMQRAWIASGRRTRLFKVECKNVTSTDGIKYGCKSQRIVEEVDKIQFTLTKRQTLEFRARLHLSFCKSDVKLRKALGGDCAYLRLALESYRNTYYAPYTKESTQKVNAILAGSGVEPPWLMLTRLASYANTNSKKLLFANKLDAIIKDVIKKK